VNEGSFHYYKSNLQVYQSENNTLTIDFQLILSSKWLPKCESWGNETPFTDHKTPFHNW